MEVGEVLATLKRHLGAAGDDPLFEGLVAGTATMPVTGVATCAAPSLAVLRRAAADGCNLVLADGHPFYSYDAAWIAKGAADAIAHAPVTIAKADYMRRASLAVIRLPSAWAVAMPAAGSLSLATWLELGAGVPAPGGGDFAVVAVPRTTLGALARRIGRRGAFDGIRLIGDTTEPVGRVAIANGLVTPKRMAAMLADPDVDAILCGEVIEWEAAPYFQDARAAGRRGGLILTGFAASQEPLAGALARWASQVLPQTRVMPFAQDVPIRTLAAGAAR
jgi:putative NIF3 family GTP cyclohydrolase 1 type 2